MPSSWLEIAQDSPFSLLNIPFGVITSQDRSHKRCAVAIGEHVLDLEAFSRLGGFTKLPGFDEHAHVFANSTLNEFAALGRAVHKKVREYLQTVLYKNTEHPEILKDNAVLRDSALLKFSAVTNHLPMHIGDYTDFYAGLNHAFNVGVLFRGPDNALQPNYKHLPVGYHGRASSVVISGTELRRPCGQILLPSTKPGAPKVPIFSPCRKLDYELELAAFISTGNTLGQPIPIDEANQHIFGFVLMNDWSARDIQAWEYVPLGPFGSKNFGTTISPWIVLADALEPFRSPGLRNAENSDPLLPYLQETSSNTSYDISLQIELKPAGKGEAYVVSRTNSRNMLYSFPQMIAHHTITGCNMKTGDLLGSGTISGTGTGTLGSLLEATSNGKKKIMLGSDIEREFIEDGDEITITGVCGDIGELVGFGSCKGLIIPSVANV